MGENGDTATHRRKCYQVPGVGAVTSGAAAVRESNFPGAETRPKALPFGRGHAPTEPATRAAPLQDGGDGVGFALHRERVVVHHHRSCGRVSPRADVRVRPAVPRLPDQRQVVSISSSSIRPMSSSLDFLQDYACFNSALEENRDHLREPCGRYLRGASLPGDPAANKGRGDSGGYLWGGLCAVHGEGLMGAHPNSSLQGSNHRHGSSGDSGSRGQVEVRPATSPNSGVGDTAASAAVGTGSGKADVVLKRVRSRKGLLGRVLLSNRCPSPKAVGVGQIGVDHTATTSRRSLAHGKSPDLERETSVETLSAASPLRGCVHDGLGRYIRGQDSRRIMGKENTCPLDHTGRSSDGAARTGVLRRPASAQLGFRAYRQRRGPVYSGERGPAGLAKGHNEKNSRLLLEKRHLALQHSPCTLRAQSGGRSQSSDRYGRLESSPRNFSLPGSALRPTYNRPDGRQKECPATSVQFPVVLSRLGSSGLLHAGLGGGDKLGSAAVLPNTSSSPTYSRVRGNSHGSAPTMGRTAMVADGPQSGESPGRITPGRGGLLGGAGRGAISGAATQPRVALSGGTIPPREHLRAVGLRIISMATAKTEKRSAQFWKEFCAFCEREQVPSLPASELIVRDFLGWWHLSGRGATVKMAVCAIAHFHRAAELPVPTESFAVRTLWKAILKIAKQDAAPQWPREGLPVSALRSWVSNPPQNVSGVLWARDAALVALGLRLMRRPGELCQLRLSDIRWQDGLLWFRIRRSKTDPFAHGFFIPVEPLDSPCCPIRLLEKYLAIRPERTPDFPNGTPDFLFLSVKGGQLTSAALSSVVKKVAAHCLVKGKFSGHSLRIGGATAAMSGGVYFGADSRDRRLGI